MCDPTKLRSILDAWAATKGDNEKASKLAENHPNCVCEKASPRCFGPVEDDEALFHFIVLPFAEMKDGFPSRAVFRNIFKRGMSVHRQNFATKDEVRRSASGILEAARKSLNSGSKAIVGTLSFCAKDVRYDKKVYGDQRVCCVLETPSEEKPSHADVVHCKSLIGKERTTVEVQLMTRILANNGFMTLASHDPYDLSSL